MSPSLYYLFLYFWGRRMLSADRTPFTGTPWVGRVARLIAGYILFAFAWAPTVHAEYGLNFQAAVSPIAEEITSLHNLILIICVVIFLIVFGVMFYALFKHRKSRGYKAAKFHDNVVLEVI